MSYKTPFTGYPAFPYVYAFWQVRRVATMNVSTTWYLRNGLRYLNQIWHVDVGRYSTLYMMHVTTSSAVQYGAGLQLEFSLKHPYPQNSIRYPVYHYVIWRVSTKECAILGHIDTAPIWEPGPHKSSKGGMMRIFDPSQRKLKSHYSFKASNQICTKFGDLKWVATVIAGHPSVQYSLASWEHAVHAHLPSHLVTVLRNLLQR